MNMPTRETGTILAALRLWQIYLEGRMPNTSEYEEIGGIATDGQTFEKLNAAEIDALCETINLGDIEAHPLRAALENAHSALGAAQTQFEQCAKMFRDDQEFIEAHGLVDEACEIAGKALRDSPVTAADDQADAAEQERIAKYREAANGLTSSNNEEIQIDDDAKVSMGSDPGAYVAAWIWVTNKEAGIEEPAGS